MRATGQSDSGEEDLGLHTHPRVRRRKVLEGRGPSEAPLPSLSLPFLPLPLTPLP